MEPPHASEEILWQPTSSDIKNAQLTRFWRRAEQQEERHFEDYASLHAWSVNYPEEFWQLCAEFTGVYFSTGPSSIKVGDRMPGTRWFDGARLNFAEHLLQRSDDHTALICLNETGEARRFTYADLRRRVAQTVVGLRALGVQPGDRVAGYIVNGPEAVIGFLACATFGAIWTACSPDFGHKAALDRLKPLEPKILIASDRYVYGGKDFDRRSEIRAIQRALPSLTATVVVPYSENRKLDLDPGWIAWDELSPELSAADLDFTQLPFDHPIYVLFSSGTTGPPKCIVHSAGGVLLQHRKEHTLHTDLRQSDVLLYLTTCGWMMWNWMISALATGCTIVLYEGNTMHPNPNAIWRLITQYGVSVFGTSAAHIDACRHSDIKPSADTDLDCLRVVLSTGSALSPSGFRWIRDYVKRDARISSISGGTDLVSCFVLGNPLLPVRAGQIQCVGLGMDVAALNKHGDPVLDTPAELVCRSPFPSMPLRFWNDPNNRAYHAAYFEKTPGMWTHGDLIEFKTHGGIVIHGRSDTTLNPGGIRIGTAEIYRALDTIIEVVDALAAGLRHDSGEEIVLFVVPHKEAKFGNQLKLEIRNAIRTAASPRHVPRYIVAVSDLPKTRNGKLAEIAVARILRGESVTNVESLANPEALQEFVEARDLLLADKLES